MDPNQNNTEEPTYMAPDSSAPANPSTANQQPYAPDPSHVVRPNSQRPQQFNDFSRPESPQQPYQAVPPASPEPLINQQPPVYTAPVQQTTPGVVVGGMGPATQQPAPFAPTGPGVPQNLPKKRWRPGKLGVVVIALAVLLVGAAAFYFGYYTNPSVILSQGMKNSGKGAEKLVDYFDNQSKTTYKGMKGSGTYKINAGGTSTDGSLKFVSYDGNSDTTFDIGLGVTRVKGEVRTIKSSSDTPDFYFKGSGIKGLGSLTGSAEIDNTINQLDNKWISIDHTLIDNLTGAMSADAEAAAQPTPSEADIVDELHTFNKVNQEYVFTTNKDKAIAKVTKKHGTENVNGHKAYRYTMVLDKDNVKAYIGAQKDALGGSKLGSWIKKNGYQSDVNESFKSMQESADNITDKDTFDLWVDVKTRLIYKIRIADSENPVSNYTDFGVDYKGTESYPIFISGKSSADGINDSGIFILTLNGKTNSLGLKMELRETGASHYDMSGDFTFTPSNDKVEITAPSGAEPLSAVLDQLGLSDLLNSYSESLTAPADVVPDSPTLVQ